jgi:hypothetical protein
VNDLLMPVLNVSNAPRVESSLFQTGTNMIPAGLDFADVTTQVGTLVGSEYILAALVAVVALGFAPRILRLIRGATRGR